MADRKLRSSVYVAGTWHIAGSSVPAEVAEQISNPNVFEDQGDAPEPAPPVKAAPTAKKAAAPKK